MSSAMVVVRPMLLIGIGATAFLGLMARPETRAASADTAAPNVIPLAMRTPRHGINRLLISITLCRPGTQECSTLDDVMVDTGSVGLRIEPGVIPSGLSLPAFLGRGAVPLAECLRFVHDQVWGHLVRADLHLGQMMAPDLPIEIIAPDDAAHPPECPASGVVPTAKATLGIAGPLTDCADPCDDSAAPMYFQCADDSCRPLRGPIGAPSRVPNPVSRLLEHNNGVVFDLPAVPPNGAQAVVGTLTFGIDTADNNRLGQARVLSLDDQGQFTTVLSGRAYPRSTIDSGTPTYVVPGEEIRHCPALPWALCASPTLSHEAEIVGRDGISLAASFKVGDFAALTSAIGVSDAVAVAEPSARGMVWGAPLFLGKRIFFGFERRDEGEPRGGRAYYGFTAPP